MAFTLLPSAGQGILSVRAYFKTGKALSGPLALGISAGYVLLLFVRPEFPAYVPTGR